MEEIKWLMNSRWVLKKQHEDQYFKLKDNYKHYKDFLLDKMGYQVTINPLLVKVDKIPGQAETWMGIQAFKEPMSYALFCLVLMFLEERDPQEQFVLGQLTAYIESHYPQENTIDWTHFGQRKLLIQVLTFTEEMGMVGVTDGSIRAFEGNGEMALLYENTGVSKYFMRHFHFDIHQCTNVADLQRQEWDTSEIDRGLVRRHRVYRKLITTPIVYEEIQPTIPVHGGTGTPSTQASGQIDADYAYIKNQRGAIENDLEKALGASLHVHKQGALMLMQDTQHLKSAFPDRRMISDIVLQLCHQLQQQYGSTITTETQALSMAQFDAHIATLQNNSAHGWGKLYREMSQKALRQEILGLMKDFAMIRTDYKHTEVILMPVIGKFAGVYPKDYLNKRSRMAQGDPENQEEA